MSAQAAKPPWAQRPEVFLAQAPQPACPWHSSSNPRLPGQPDGCFSPTPQGRDKCLSKLPLKSSEMATYSTVVVFCLGKIFMLSD